MIDGPSKVAYPSRKAHGERFMLHTQSIDLRFVGSSGGQNPR